ncbi:MAG: hypothetical protein WAQ98_08545 [Blastocatellia bacterium]|jgi:hypothetical protein
MSSSQLIIKKKNPPTRCEICHLADQFDPLTETCQRCYNLALPVINNNNSLFQQQIEPVSQGFDKTLANLLAYSFLLMIGSLSLTILFGIFQMLPIALIFGAISLLAGIGFVAFLLLFTLYMVGTILASLVQSIYHSFRARSQ